MRLLLHLVRLPLVRPFRTTHGTKRVQTTLIVELRDDGVAGFGESPASGTWHSRPEDVARRLEALRPRIEDLARLSPEEAWPRLRDALEGDTFALAAVDTALHDLHARRLGRPLVALFGGDPERAPPSSFSLAAEHAADMREEVAAAPPFPIYKVKVRSEEELPHVAALFGATSARIRVDANEAWSAEAAARCVPALEDLGVELVEQPMPRDAWAEHRALRARARVPLVADESCHGPADVPRCAEAFHGVNVKLVKAGGLTPALATIRAAREAGLGVMIGCMVETSVAISAAAHLAPLADWVDLDGALLLAGDAGDGVRLPDGRLRFPDRPGTGFEPDRTVLR